MNEKSMAVAWCGMGGVLSLENLWIQSICWEAPVTHLTSNQVPIPGDEKSWEIPYHNVLCLCTTNCEWVGEWVVPTCPGPGNAFSNSHPKFSLKTVGGRFGKGKDVHDAFSSCSTPE